MVFSLVGMGWKTSKVRDLERLELGLPVEGGDRLDSSD